MSTILAKRKTVVEASINCRMKLLLLGLIVFQFLVYYKSPQSRVVYESGEGFDNPTVPGTSANETGSDIQSREEGTTVRERPLLDSNATFDVAFDMRNFNASEFRLLFVHVGKTGGMTMNKVLRSSCDIKRNKEAKKTCYAELCCSQDELLLSKLTSNALHLFIPRAKHLKRDYQQRHELLWTLRNPISRTISALDMKANNVYANKVGFWEDVYFRQCGFRTVQDLANALEFKNKTKGSSSRHIIQIPKNHKPDGTEMVDLDCHKFGRKTLEGSKRGSMAGHNTYNYEYYSQVPKNLPNKTNFVLRTEYLWEDVIQTNELLVHAAVASQEQPNTRSTTWLSDLQRLSTHKYTHGSESWNIKSNMTQRGKEILCCYLSKENQIYEKLLWSAVNLNDQQKSQALESLYQDCGILPLESSSSILVGGFGWKEWRSKGCPTA